ncbi:hypothetical protein LUZ60_017458 [Juncus effusus]|nr:hypothetical protein LUZ60_017458 [Juncus effusus]
MEGDENADETRELVRKVFQWDPVSFRVRRKSALKLAVSQKLHGFLGDFDDLTLVEYIIVLICNGKTQYQTRDDLEEFIGENTDRFIAWLWDYLRRENDITEVRETGNYLKNKIEAQNEVRISEADEQSGDTSLEKDGSIEERYYSADAEYPSRSLRISSEISTGGVQFSPYYQKSRREKREEKIYRTESPIRASRSFQRSRSDIISQGHNSHFTNREELRVREAEKIKPPNKKLEMDKGSKPRHKSIWDRLDKPTNETKSRKATKKNPSFRERNHNDHFSRERNPNPNPNPVPPVPVPLSAQNFHPCPHFVRPVPVFPNPGPKVFGNQVFPNTGFQIPGFGNPGIGNPGFEKAEFEMASLRKRQFEQIEKDLYERRVPVKQRLKFINNTDEFGNNEKIQPQNGGVDQVENQSDVQSENKNEASQNEILEMKLKLEEMEKNMNELRSNLKLDSKINPNSEVSSNQPDELTQSRTVLVTNVHFGAKKEALVAHFSKCGTVAKVVILTDSVTAQPKGAAYVIFTTKESAEKALSLNNTSFFSRVINVVRKADRPAGFLPPAQQLRKLPAQHPLQFRRNGHLQWKRESVDVPTESSNNIAK